MTPVLKSTRTVIAVFTVSLAHASSPESVPEGNAPAEFSCAAKPLDLSREELEKVAFAEYAKKGGRIVRAEWETKLVRRGCDWWVFFSLVPGAPGMHFGVLVDG